MPFSFLKSQVPAQVKSSFPAASLAMRRREVSERAGLLRRLGHSQEEALRRCQAYEAWEHEPFHRSPLAAEVATLVAEVYQSKTGRVTSLTPGT